MILKKSPRETKIAQLRRQFSIAAVASFFLLLAVRGNVGMPLLGILFACAFVFFVLAAILLPVVLKLWGDTELEDSDSDIPLDIEQLIDEIGENEATKAERHKILLKRKAENTENAENKQRVKLKKRYNMSSSKGHSPF